MKNNQKMLDYGKGNIVLKRLQLPLFFLMAFIISWAIWIPQAAATLGICKSAISIESALNLIAVWGPGLAAIILSVLAKSKEGAKKLFRPIKYWRVGIHWYIFVLFYPISKWLVAYIIDTLLGQSYKLGSSPILSFFNLPEQAIMIPIAVVSTFLNTLGEEVGWRGFALPKLQVKYTAFVSTIIIGLFWGFWHIPMWIAQGYMDLSLLHIITKTLSIVPLAIIFTWVYNSTKGSLLLVWLFHASITITGYFAPSLPTTTEEILSWVVAIIIVIVAGLTHLSRKKRIT